MLTTESEAKTKWCPNTRVARMTPGSLPPGNVCIGSACMAWRTSHRERGAVMERIDAVPNSVKPAGDDWGYQATDPTSAAKGGQWVRYEIGPLVGYCGDFGRPES